MKMYAAERTLLRPTNSFANRGLGGGGGGSARPAQTQKFLQKFSDGIRSQSVTH
jgi:hypothetical protein